jgi:hypothetical protein
MVGEIVWTRIYTWMIYVRVFIVGQASPPLFFQCRGGSVKQNFHNVEVRKQRDGISAINIYSPVIQLT